MMKIEVSGIHVPIQEEVDKHIRKKVEKLTKYLESHKHRARLAQERMSSEHESLPEARSEVIHITRQIAKPMNMDEAAMQLDLSQEKFLVFLNAATEQVNVMYKMTSGGYGLIEPQL